MQQTVFFSLRFFVVFVPVFLWVTVPAGPMCFAAVHKDISPHRLVASSVSGTESVQVRSARHVLAFFPDKVIFGGMGHALMESFIDADPVVPQMSRLSADFETRSAGNGTAGFVVNYPGLWQGISLRYAAEGDAIVQTTYTLDPYADPDRILLEYGVSGSVMPDGSLRFTMPSGLGWFSLSAPVAWQMAGERRIAVDVAYELRGERSYGFRLGGYDRSRPLYIDPVYTWRGLSGSVKNDYGRAIAVDAAGNIYVAGSSEDNFDHISGNGTVPAPLHAHNPNGLTNTDLTVCKLSSNGNLQWYTMYGSSMNDYATSIAVDATALYITGESAEGWVGDSDRAPLHAYTGLSDITVLKLTRNGVYQWHTFYGSASGQDKALDIAVDGTFLYVVGESEKSWQAAGSTAPVHAHSGGNATDMAIVKIGSDGTYNWHTFYGAAALADTAAGVAVDNSHDIVVAGTGGGDWSGMSQWPLHARCTTAGVPDIAVMKLSPAGICRWYTFYGSCSADSSGKSDASGGVVLDPVDNIYVVGTSYDSWQGDGSTDPLHPHGGGSEGGEDIVALSLDSRGVYRWHTFYGSSGSDVGNGISFDRGIVTLAGYSWASWLGDGGAQPDTPFSGIADVVTIRLDHQGAYHWHGFYGSSALDFGTGVDVYDRDSIFVVGSSWENNNKPDIMAMAIDDILVINHRLQVFVNLIRGASGTVTSVPDGIHCTSSICQADYEYGTSVTLTATPNPFSSVFGGWSGDCVSSPHLFMDGSKQCTAYFVPKPVNITTIAAPESAGTVVCAPNPGEYGASSTCTITPASGYRTESTGGTCGLNHDGGFQYTTDTLTADCTVTANFIRVYPITETAQPTSGGTVDCDPNPVDTGDTSTCRILPNSGNRLVSVSGDCGGDFAPGSTMDYITDPVNAACTVLAEFRQIHTILEKTNDPSGGSVACTPNPVDHNDSAACTITINPGYRLEGVYGDCGGTLAGSVYTTYPITSDCTVDAHFIEQHNITAAADPVAGGLVICTPNPVDHGLTSVCNITADNGYVLDTVDGTCGGTLSGSSYQTNVVTTDCTVTAHFLETHAVTVVSSPAAGGSTVCSPNPVPHGGVSVCTITPSHGYLPDTVSGTCGGFLSGAEYTTGPVTAPCDATVNFVTAHDINTTVSPVGAGTVACTPSPVKHGGVSVCTITANHGFHLTGADSTCGGSLSGNVYTTTTIMADCTVHADFGPGPYTLTVETNGGPGRIISTPAGIDCIGGCSADFAWNSTVSLQALTDPPYRFAGWSGNCDNQGRVVMNGDRHCTVHFKSFSWQMFLPAIIPVDRP
jgi:hypothetical protein